MDELNFKGMLYVIILDKTKGERRARGGDSMYRPFLLLAFALLPADIPSCYYTTSYPAPSSRPSSQPASIHCIPHSRHIIPYHTVPFLPAPLPIPRRIKLHTDILIPPPPYSPLHLPLHLPSILPL